MSVRVTKQSGNIMAAIYRYIVTDVVSVIVQRKRHL